ncbi:hypothetical protein [Thalassospira povalilytica]|uniref:hypothetical protein n=1 Tax=Thalassospira povalilytica TaxID=732237 RepID=UPI003AA93052
MLRVIAKGTHQLIFGRDLHCLIKACRQSPKIIITLSHPGMGQHRHHNRIKRGGFQIRNCLFAHVFGVARRDSVPQCFLPGLHRKSIPIAKPVFDTINRQCRIDFMRQPHAAHRQNQHTNGQNHPAP